MIKLQSLMRRMKGKGMMNFETFSAEIKNRLPGEIEKMLPGYYVKFGVTPKVNGVKESVRGGKSEDCVMRNIYFDDLYEEYLEHNDIGKTISDIIFALGCENFPVRKDEFISLINDKERIKKLVSYFVINREMNSELLENIPHRQFLDLAVVYKFSIYRDSESVGKVIITNEMTKKWEMTEEELYSYARYNTERLCATTVKKISPDFMIITNETAINGAVAIIDRVIIRSVAEDMGEDIYIVPSSVHDLIALRSSSFSAPDIFPVIKHVNDDVVNREDILSYNLYRYSLKDNSICIVNGNSISENC